MLIKSPIFHFFLISNLFKDSYSVTRKASKIQNLSKAPLKIVGSDDEVLHPLFEKEEADAHTSNKPAISGQNPFRSPKTNKKEKGKKKKSLSIEDHSFLKMNLDLPSIVSSSASTPLKPAASSQQNPSTATSLKYGSGMFNFKNEVMKKDQELTGNFNSPFGNELVEDIDIVIFRNITTNPIVPGTVLASKQSSLAPGTVIASTSSTVQPGTVIVENSKIIASKASDEIQSNLNGFDAATFETGNKISDNDENLDYKQPSISLPPTLKKIRSLDEYSIESLSFDPMIPGPKIGLDTEISIDFINNILIPFFKSGKVLDRKSSFSVSYFNNIFFKAFRSFTALIKSFWKKKRYMIFPWNLVKKL